MSDLKIFALVGLVAGGIIYALLFSGDWDKSKFRHQPVQTPTIQFVRPGTPGAKTFDQLRQDQLEQSRRRWGIR